jgi:hypothetical protein
VPHSKEYQRAYYVANRERLLEKARRERGVEGYSARRKKASAKYRAENREKIRGYSLAKHGLTLHDYNYLMDVQGSVCRICGAEAQKEKHGRLHVDHDHATGEIRGLLCARCNMGLGLFQDSPAILASTIDYLKRGYAVMSSFTFADLKLGGRLTAACDAVGAGHLRKAAGLFNEVADDLNTEAEATTGLLAPDEDDWSAPLPEAPKPAPAPQAAPADLQACARNVHSYGAPDPVSGWRTCSACGIVNVAPPDSSVIDIGMRGG